MQTKQENELQIKNDIGTAGYARTVGEDGKSYRTGISSLVSGAIGDDIEQLENDVEALQTTVGEHTADIQNNSDDISDLQTLTSGHTTSIGNLQTAVGTNTEDITDLKEDLDTQKEYIDANCFTTNILYQGDITVSGTGTYVNTEILSVTEFSEGDSFSFGADSVTGASNQTPFYIYVKNGSSNVGSSTSGNITITAAHVTAGANKIVFLFYPATGTALPTGTATATNIKIRKTSNQALVIADVFRDAIRGQAVNDILLINNLNTKDYISALMMNVYERMESVNLIPSFDHGKLLNDDGTITNNASYACTAKFQVNAGSKIVFTRKATATTRTAERYGVVFYTDEDSIASISASFSNSVRTVPSNAVSAIVCIYDSYTTSGYAPMVEYTDGTTIASEYHEYFAPYWSYQPSATKRNSDKAICVFGDSLAASGNGGTDTWIQRVGDSLGFSKVYNRGVGSSMVTDGTTMYAYVDDDGDAYNRGAYTTHQTFAGYTEINACLSSTDRADTIPTDTDVLLILAGANDVGQIGSAGKAEFTADYKTMLDNIYARVPNALVYLCTMPFHYAFDTGASAETYEDYRQIIREIGHEYGFPIIDLKYKMMVNKNNYAEFMNDDNIHYNTEAGRDRTAEAVIPYLYSYIYL